MGPSLRKLLLSDCYTLLLSKNRVIRINKIVLSSGSSLSNKKLAHIQISVVEDCGLRIGCDQ